MRLVVTHRLFSLTVPLALAAIAVAPGASWAGFDAYLKIADCPTGDGPGIQLSGFNSRVSVPTAAATGLATGRTQLTPIQILKNLDKCSPQFFLDAVTGRVVQSAEITFFQTSTDGVDVPFFKVTLRNVIISGIETTTVAPTGQNDLRNIQSPTAVEVNVGGLGGIQEILSLSFQRIELTDLVTNTTTSFDVVRRVAP